MTSRLKRMIDQLVHTETKNESKLRGLPNLGFVSFRLFKDSAEQAFELRFRQPIDSLVERSIERRRDVLLLISSLFQNRDELGHVHPIRAELTCSIVDFPDCSSVRSARRIRSCLVEELFVADEEDVVRIADRKRR